MVTVIDCNSNLHIIAALLRMGNGTSVTDNYHDGGMACPIDIDTGKLTSTAYSMNLKQFEIHPFSQIEFEGYYIKDFHACMQIVRELAFVCPAARYVGWDLAVTPTGIEMLEANIPPGEDITQLATKEGIYKTLELWK